MPFALRGWRRWTTKPAATLPCACVRNIVFVHYPPVVKQLLPKRFLPLAITPVFSLVTCVRLSHAFSLPFRAFLPTFAIPVTNPCASSVYARLCTYPALITLHGVLSHPPCCSPPDLNDSCEPRGFHTHVSVSVSQPPIKDPLFFGPLSGRDLSSHTRVASLVSWRRVPSA